LSGLEKELGELSKETIESFLSAGFETRLFAASLANLADELNPLRFNNFAYSIRELVRHVLARVAPDESVTRCSWYANETKTPGRISRGERIKYGVQGGLEDNYVADDLGIDIGAVRRTLRDAIDDLSKFTHVGEDTFGIGNEECDSLSASTLEALSNFAGLIGDCKSAVLKAIDEHLEDAVISEVLSETVVSVDSIATHHSIEEVYLEKKEVMAIDEAYIYIRATGSVYVELQWGSNSDVKNDIGAEGAETFPLFAELTIDINDLSKVSVIEASISVDTSSWYGEEEPSEP
jgi:hypothetical protein